MRAAFDAWTNTWPNANTEDLDDYKGGPEFDAVVLACSSSLDNLEFLVQRMEADPEFNSPCLAAYDSSAPADLVVQPPEDIGMDKAVSSVKLYRSAHPYSLDKCSSGNTMGGCCFRCKAIIAFCGPMHCGKTTAAKAVGEALFSTRMYDVYQWSFATALKNFCMKYYDEGAGVTSGILDAYYRDKLVVPPSARMWAGTGSVILPPASRISELLIISGAENATRARDRLLKIFSLDLAESPLKLSGRRIMQVTGSVFRDVCGPNFWIKQLANAMNSTPRSTGAVHIIDDVRFPNEALWLKMVGASVVRIVSPETSREPPKHISEMCVEEVPADFVFENDGTSVADLASGLMPFVLSVIHNKSY